MNKIIKNEVNVIKVLKTIEETVSAKKITNNNTNNIENNINNNIQERTPDNNINNMVIKNRFKNKKKLLGPIKNHYNIEWIQILNT